MFSSGAGTLNFTAGGTDALTVRSDGDVDLPGSIRKAGTLFLHNLGSLNTAVGLGALAANSTGAHNTASGYAALGGNITWGNNIANGELALARNTTGRPPDSKILPTGLRRSSATPLGTSTRPAGITHLSTANEKTKRAYKLDVAEFSAFTGLKEPTQLRTVARAHVITSHLTLQPQH